MTLPRLLTGAAMALCLTLPATAQDAVTADTVVASVGGEDITIGHLIAMRGTLSDQNKQLPDAVLFEGLIERIIQQRAVSQSVETVGRATELALENERNAMIAGAVVNELAASIKIADEALQQAYDEKYADWKEFNASHILVASEEEAQALVTELEGGADFAELAKEKSTGPSGPNGGELGWFGPGMMVPPFEAAVMSMDTGEVSEPVKTQFGWHVVKLNETREAEPPAFDTVRAELEATLWEQQLRAEIAAIVEGADVTRADVSGIDPAILRDTSLIAE